MPLMVKSIISKKSNYKEPRINDWHAKNQQNIHLITPNDFDIHQASINRLMITDQQSNRNYLIDTGADVSVIPATPQDLTNSPYTTTLYAANGTRIKTYGEKRLTMNLGLRRQFNWRFIIADVKQPIIGADFIVKHGLLIDLKHKKLIDQQTNLEFIGSIHKIDPDTACIKAYNGKDKFQRILAEYTDLTNPNASHGSEKINVFHHIETKGATSFCRPRRLTPEKYKDAKGQRSR